jgi:hypothetical protein
MEAQTTDANVLCQPEGGVLSVLSARTHNEWLHTLGNTWSGDAPVRMYGLIIMRNPMEVHASSVLFAKQSVI